jgi:hypothetical protein
MGSFELSAYDPEIFDERVGEDDDQEDKQSDPSRAVAVRCA